MALYRLVVEGEAREVYTVEADNLVEAKRVFTNGDAGTPDVAEVTGAEVVAVERIENDA